MKKTLLEIVKSILNDMDSEDVDSLADSVEAMQVASIVQDTFYNFVSTKQIPEHKELFKLTALSDSDYPTHFKYPASHRKTEKVWYKDSGGTYKEVCFADPEVFLKNTDGLQENYGLVYDKNGGTELRIRNNQDPTFYTSFDDEYIVMNSYDSTVDSTLQSSKVRAFGYILPTFSITDDFTPDIDDVLFPYLLAESKSTSMSILKGDVNPKVDQAARRQKNFIQNDMFNTERANNWSNYGRK